jgi:hypothetical protein
MLVDAPLRPSQAELKQPIERHIRQRTSQRIDQLHVQVDGNRVIVHGQASCYYVKQLAIQAALEALGSRLVADVRIGVGAPGMKPAPSRPGASEVR